MITIYFTDKSLKFAPADYVAQAGERVIVPSELTRAKVINFFETCNTIVALCDDCHSAFEHFAAQFVAVEAAGGVVFNDDEQLLMILRRNRWDLPKGHIEPGEDAATAALREVEEETGVSELKIVASVCNTLHAYCVYGKWELKRTHWFAMRSKNCSTVPQSEEGIEAVAWCGAQSLAQNLKTTYPTIREVIYEYSCKNIMG